MWLFDFYGYRLPYDKDAQDFMLFNFKSPTVAVIFDKCTLVGSFELSRLRFKVA